MLLHIASQYAILTFDVDGIRYDILDKFNVDNEISIPTWYAQTLLLLGSLIAAFISAHELKKRTKYRYHWIGIALGLCYLSIDEGAELHELLIEPMQELFSISSGPLFFAWLIPVGLAVILLGIVYAKFWWILPVNVKKIFLYAVIVFLAGSIGMEMISGNYWQANNFDNNFTYRLFNAIEEGLEYIGISLAIYGLLQYSDRHI